MQLPYLPPLLLLLLLLLLPFSHRFWGVVFLFFFSAIPAIVLFSPSPLMMIITQSSSNHTNYPSIFGFSFYFSFYFSFLFSFPFSVPCGGTRRCVPSKSFSKSKQADSNSKSLLARSIACSVGSFLFLSNSMKAEREVRRKYLCLLCIHIKIVEQSIDRSIFFFFFFMLQVSSRRRNVGLTKCWKGKDTVLYIVNQHTFLRCYLHCIATALSTIDLPFLTGGIDSLFFPFACLLLHYSWTLSSPRCREDIATIYRGCCGRVPERSGIQKMQVALEYEKN